MSDPQTEARIIAHLTDLRSRLLDVRAVDRWLNVLHSGPLSALLALLDETSAGLHEKLTSGRDLFFHPVPYPDAAWEREYEGDFAAALEEERAVDLGWREAQEAGEAVGSARLNAVEMDLRARVAQKLGLPCREVHPAQVVGEWLRQRGVDFAGLVRDGSEGGFVVERSENELQTAWWGGDLSVALGRVWEDSELLFSERAEESVYVVLGFLEWMPAGGELAGEAGVCRAPLVVYPVEWACRMEGGRDRLGIRGFGGPQTNEVLRRRLQGVAETPLPHWEPEDSVETYWNRVEAWGAGNGGWRVVRNAAFGVFPTSPAWVYSDLDPRHWGGFQALAGAGVLQVLWERPIGGFLYEEEREEGRSADAPDPADVGVARAAGSEFFEVDADQEQVARLASNGRGVRVDAPPGTGATQALLNLLASLLARSQSVLVVSERGSALREIAERAREWGLGPYCLELFGVGLRTASLLDGVVERQRVQISPGCGRDESAEREYAACTRSLDQHLTLIRQAFGELEVLERGRWRQLTVHDVVWENVLLREQAPRFAGLDRVWLEDVEFLTRADRERRRSRLGILERAAREMRERWAGVEGHPWGFVTRGDIQAADVPDVEEVAAQALVRLEELRACGDALVARMRFDVEASTLTEVLEFARLLQVAPLPPQGVPDLLVRMVLLSTEAEERVREGAGWLREVRRRREMLAAFFDGRPPEVLEEEEWGEAVSAARMAGLGDVALQSIAARAEELRRRLGMWERLKPFVEKCVQTLGLGKAGISVPVLQRVVQALELLAGAERRVLLVRTPALLEEINQPVLEGALSAVRALREGEQRVRSVYAYEVGLSETELREHANVLAGAGLWVKWSGAFRRALSQARALVKQHAGLTPEQLAVRMHQLADHLEAVRRFESDEPLRRLLGVRFRGPLTDLESCVEANQLAACVRCRFVGQWEPEISLRRFFLEGSMDDFDSALALRADGQFAELVAFVESSEGAAAGMEDLVAGWGSAADEAQRLFRYFGGFGLRADATPNEALEVRFNFAEVRELADKLEASSVRTWMGVERWQRELTDPGALDAALEYAAKLHAAVPAGVVRVVASGDGEVEGEVEEVRSQGLTLEGGTMRAFAALRALQGWVADPAVPVAVSPVLAPFLTVGAVHGALRKAQEHGGELTRCVAFRRAVDELRADGLAGLLQAYEEAGEDYGGLEEAYDRVLWRSFARRVVELFPDLGQGSVESPERERLRWIEARRRCLAARREEVLASLAAVPVRRSEMPGLEASEGADLAPELLDGGNEGATMVSRWVERAWEGLRVAKPCVFASPESVARYLAPGHRFDWVIVEGASRFRPERAMGALARGRRMVLFGDEMQLPASTYLERRVPSFAEFTDQRAEDPSLWSKGGSALDPCALRGQYRAGSAALMAFSNRYFYRNEIRLLPGPKEWVPADPAGLRLVRTRGEHRNGVHAEEARAASAEALRCMRMYPERSLAIVTWTAAQRVRVQAEIDRIAAGDPDAERYRARWASGREPFMVRQVDDMQGEVRDVVVVTMGMTAEVPGVIEGAARLEGWTGARRLNVALTRARVGMCVFCGVDPQRVRVDHRTSRGVVLLRQFLLAASEGGKTEVFSETPAGAWERFFAGRLDADGFDSAVRAGGGNWRVDLAVSDAARQTGFLGALVGDGSGSAEASAWGAKEWLAGTGWERLGWRVHRIWSGEWFRDAVREKERLREFARGGAGAEGNETRSQSQARSD